MPLLQFPAKPTDALGHRQATAPSVPDDLRPAVECLLRDMAFILHAAQSVRKAMIEAKTAN